MTKTALILCTVLTLSACATVSQSRLNPLNWFGSSTAVATPQTGPRVALVPAGGGGPVDARGLIDTITALQIDRSPTGALVRATGVASTQGQFNAQLVPIGVENGTLTLAFRVEGAAGQGVGTVRSRQISAARTFGFDELAGVRSIQVQGAQNARIASR